MLSRNAIANLVQPGFAWLVVLVLPPLLIRTLERPTYATWMLLLQIGAYVSMLNDSIRACGRHFVGRALGLDDNDYLTRILSSGTVILVAAAVLATLLSAFASHEFPHLFHSIPAAIIPQAKLALLLIGFSLAAGLPFSILSGVFEGYQKSGIPAVLTAVFRVGGAFGIGWAAYRQQGLIAMAIWYGASNLLPRLSYVPAWQRWGEKNLFRFSRVTVAACREFLHFWSGLLASQFCGILISGMDLPIVAAFDFRNAAYYAIATTLSNILMVPYGAMIAAIQPVASSMSAQSSPERVGQALVKVTRWSIAVLTLLVLPLLSGMSLFLHVWVGSDYKVRTLPFGIVLVIAVFIRECMRPYAVMSMCAGRQRRTLYSPSVEAVVNLAFSLLLVHYIGAIGVAVGTLIGAFVGVGLHLTVSMRLTSDVIRVGRFQLIWEGILRPLFCAVPAFLLTVVVQHSTSSPVLRALSIASATGATALALFKWNFKAHERSEIHRFVRRSLRLAPVAPVAAHD